MQIGRKAIFTDEPEISYKNIIPVLRKAIAEHEENSGKINFLLNYEAGEQPLRREKKYRSDINCICEDNVANEVTEFNLGFKWGNPITFVQRGAKESWDENEILGISLLNDCYESENIKSKTQQLGRFIEICGLGYTYVDINMDWQDGDSFFKIEALDPRCTFVVKSSYYIDQRPMLGVTYRKDSHGNRYFTCFSKDTRFEIFNAVAVTNGKTVQEKESWNHADRSGEENPLHIIPIIEWIRAYDRMGCFERQISEMDNLNILISDFTNDVDQNTQAIWHCNDVEFPMEVVEDSDGNKVEVVRKPKTNEFLQTFTSQDGKTPFVNPLAVAYDYAGMLNNIITRRSLILQKCNVPQRNDNSGGSTGVAMSDATGWSAAEMAASKQQNIMEACKMNEVKVVLAAIKASTYVSADSPLLKLKPSDLQPNIKRQKTYELTVKINGICALLAKGFSLDDTMTMIPLAEDPNQVIARSGPGVKAYQDANVFKADTQAGQDDVRPFPDYSDQENNSPNIGGMEMKQETIQQI